MSALCRTPTPQTGPRFRAVVKKGQHTIASSSLSCSTALGSITTHNRATHHQPHQNNQLLPKHVPNRNHIGARPNHQTVSVPVRKVLPSTAWVHGPREKSTDTIGGRESTNGGQRTTVGIGVESTKTRRIRHSYVACGIGSGAATSQLQPKQRSARHVVGETIAAGSACLDQIRPSNLYRQQQATTRGGATPCPPSTPPEERHPRPGHHRINAQFYRMETRKPHHARPPSRPRQS